MRGILSRKLARASMLASKLSHSPLFHHQDTRLPSAWTAFPHELEPLLCDRPETAPSLLVGVGPFGRVLRVRPTSDRRELGNMLVTAPTRGGKGLLAISQLLTWPHSVVVNDIKGELFHLTAGYRQRLGPVFVIDPRGVGHSTNPLRSCRTEDDLRAMAVHLLYKSHEREPDPFTKRAVKMLTAIFGGGLLEGAALLPYAAHLLQIGPESAAARLDALSKLHGLPENKNLATRLLDRTYENADFSDRYLESSWSTLTTDMDPITTETVIRSLSASDFSPEDILCGREVRVNGKQERRPVTVYLRWPENRLLALSALIRLIWSSLIEELINLYDNRLGRGCRPVLLLIDEAGTAPVPGLPPYAATVVGRGLSLWIAIQSLSQLDAIYGEKSARSLRDNTDTQVFYRPADLETAIHLEKRLGDQSVWARSQTMHEGSHMSEGQSERSIPLLTAWEIQFRQTAEDIIGFHRAHDELAPFRGKRMNWLNWPELVPRTKIPPPSLPVLPELAPIPPLRTSDLPEFVDPDAMRHIH